MTSRTHARGHIRKRSKRRANGTYSWGIKLDINDRDPRTGQRIGERRTKWHTFIGTKYEAELERDRLIKKIRDQSYVESSALTVGMFLMGIKPTKDKPDGMPGWLDRVAASKTSPKTLERYREIVEKNIIPALGSIRLQKLRAEDIEKFYANALISGRRDGRGGLSPQTVLHIHRILSLALQSAVKKQHIPHSPMQAVENVPIVERREIQTLSEGDLKALLKIFKGKSLYVPVMTATATGMRRGEILGLRWRDIDFDAHTLTVQQSVEQTKEGLRFKPPKTKQSRRKIALPPRLIEELKNHKRQQAEQRLTLGLGKDPNDLVFTTLDGRPRSPRTFSKEFTRTIEAANRKAKLAGGSTLLPPITFHILRHTHISNLLAGGINVKTVSDRAGHADPAITLRIYAHAIPGLDEAAATLVDASLRAALED